LAATDIDDSQKQVLIAVYLSFRGQADGGSAGSAHHSRAAHDGGDGAEDQQASH